MALNVWLVAFVVIGSIATMWWTIHWVARKITGWLDQCIPQIQYFSWVDAIEAEIRLTDGKVLKGAGGNWTCSDGTQITDLALRIALRRRYEEEVDLVIQKSKKDE